MTRDELILSCQETVNNLVKKYNNHQPDEDLQAVGMTSVIECVDRCLDEGLTDVEQVQARCNRWARNVILNEIYKKKIKYIEDNSVLDVVEAEEDLWETVRVLKSILTPRNIEVLDLLLAGYSQQEIQKKLNMAKYTYFHHVATIKQKIKSLIGTN